MLDRWMLLLLALFAVAAAGFVLGLLALGAGRDLMAVVLVGVGAVAAYTLVHATRVVEGGGR